MPDLISLEDLLTAVGQAPGDVDSQEAAKIEASIAAATAIIKQYTGRSFELNDPDEPATPRTFQYDGSGFCDIDDCIEIESVELVPGYAGAVAQPAEWFDPQPYNEGVYQWLELSSGDCLFGASPAMGFKSNADTRDYCSPNRPIKVIVTAKWGWTEFPADLKQAVVWTVMSVGDDARPYVSESIEGYSRTRWAPGNTIPDRALNILASYAQIKV